MLIAINYIRTVRAVVHKLAHFILTESEENKINAVMQALHNSCNIRVVLEKSIDRRRHLDEAVHL